MVGSVPFGTGVGLFDVGGSDGVAVGIDVGMTVGCWEVGCFG